MAAEKSASAHKLEIISRSQITVTDVSDIAAFSETKVMLQTGAGMLSIGGAGMQIKKFSVEDSLAVVEGRIDMVTYSDRSAPQGSFFARMFK